MPFYFSANTCKILFGNYPLTPKLVMAEITKVLKIELLYHFFLLNISNSPCRNNDPISPCPNNDPISPSPNNGLQLCGTFQYLINNKVTVQLFPAYSYIHCCDTILCSLTIGKYLVILYYYIYSVIILARLH